MAWYKNYYRYPYKRKYRRYSSVGAITRSRNFKASAANMTQNARFNINSVVPLTLTIPVAANAAWQPMNLANVISNSDMHVALKTVFDQYRIEKATVKVTPVVFPANVDAVCTYITAFSCVDRTGFSNNVTLAQIKTYSSYRDISWPVNGDTVPPLVNNVGQSDVIERVTYADTWNNASFPMFLFGLSLSQAVAQEVGNLSLSVTIEIDAQVRYRGVRLASAA